MRQSNLKYLLLFLFAAACDAQATPDYQGDPLLTLTGTLENQSTTPLPEADLMLAWPNYNIGADGLAPPSTFVRVQVAAQLPMQFSAEIFQPPPDSAYAVANAGWTLLGPRIASAGILLARRGITITDTSINWVDPSQNQVLANFDQYYLTYVESDGTVGLRDPDGTVTMGASVKKGFHLGRVDTTYCAQPPDQLCLDFFMMATGVITDDNRNFCTSVNSSSTSGEIPLGTPLDLVIPGPLPLASTLSPCPPSQD